VQRWIDAGGAHGRAVTPDVLREIHRRFCEDLPVRDELTKREVVVVPGKWRRDDVQVGRHVPVSAAAVPRFIERFGTFYGAPGRTATILCAAAAHHRLLWIHPFVDGNGRGRVRCSRRCSIAASCPAPMSLNCWGMGDRQARRVVAALMDRNVLPAESTRAPLRLAFPAALAGRWIPGLFPEQTV
jgi:hypothetical protein